MLWYRRLRRWTRNSPARWASDRAPVPLRTVFTALLLALAALPAWAADRVALVIGNGAYANVPSLPNPGNDAADMSASLRELGFEVFTGRDVSRAAMLRLIESFAGAAAGSDAALFYFAGHAFQVGGQNYLLPVDLNPQTPEDIPAQSVSLDVVMETMAAAPGLRFVFLDACRDNPLGLSQETGNAGLARAGRGQDFLIAYATQPGAVAFDGDGRNGTFTEALLNHIHTPGQSVADMMMMVRKDVIAATGGQQIPWENSSLTRAFAFDPGKRTVSDETMLYQVAARAGSAELMSLYLQRYPGGAHVTDASDFLIAARSTGADAGPAQGTGFAEGGEDLWQLVQRTRLRDLAQIYLDQFPDGPHAAEAQRLIDALPRPSQLGPGRLCERLATHPRDATAQTAGVEFLQLRQNAEVAIDTCRAAVETFPEQPRYVALLARATIAAGRVDEAVALYRQAASRGDLRALVSLGLLTEAGNGVPRDPQGAIDYYARAARGGSPDGAINLAVALYQGDVVPRDVDRAVSLFRRAAEAGSAIATFNLGVLAQDGTAGRIEDALGLFLRAARAGEPRGYRAAAVLLDEGRGVEKDPPEAASLLLRGAAEDRGEIVGGFAGGNETWSPETIRAMQSRLKRADLYAGAIDGLVGPQFVDALRRWRAGGFDVALLAD